MAKKELLFKSDERKTLPDVAEFLRQLADKIEAGEVVLQLGSEKVKLHLANTVQFEVEVEQKPKKHGKKQSLEIEIEWYEGDFGDSVTFG